MLTKTAAFVAVCGLVFAQAREPRHLGGTCLYSGFMVGKRTDNQVCYVTNIFGQNPDGSDVSLPFLLDGAVDLAHTESILLCGQNVNDDCILVRVASNAVTHDYEVESSVSLAGRDLVGICYLPALGKIVAADEKTGGLIWASYSPSSTLPTQWVGVPGGPSLGPDVGMVLAHTGNYLTTTSVVVSTLDGLTEIQFDLDSVGVTSVVDKSAPLITQDQLRPEDTEVSVEGAPGAVVELVRIDSSSPGAVVGYAGLDSNGDGQAFVITLPLDPDAVIAARYFGSAQIGRHCISPLSRLGVAEAIDAVTSIRPLRQETGLMLYDDHAYFTVPLWLDHSSSAGAYLGDYIVAFGVGFPSQVVEVSPGRFFLDTPTWDLRVLTVADATTPTLSIGSFPVPPGFVGLDLSFQWLVWHGAGPSLSDVVSAPIKSSVTAPVGLEDYFGVPSALMAGTPGSSFAPSLFPASSVFQLPFVSPGSGGSGLVNHLENQGFSELDQSIRSSVTGTTQSN